MRGDRIAQGLLVVVRAIGPRHPDEAQRTTPSFFNP